MGFFFLVPKSTQKYLLINLPKEEIWIISAVKMLWFFFPEHLSWWIFSLQYQPDNWKLSHWTALISKSWERFSLTITWNKYRCVKTAMNYLWKAFISFYCQGKKCVCYKTKHQSHSISIQPAKQFFPANLNWVYMGKVSQLTFLLLYDVLGRHFSSSCTKIKVIYFFP